MRPQRLTEGILRARVAELGHAPRHGHALSGFEQDDCGVIARVTTAEGKIALWARYLVGADGGRSFVRKTLGIGFPGESLNTRAVVADLSLGSLTRDVWHRWGSGGRQISLCPLQGTQLFQLQMPIPLDAEFDLSDAGLAASIAARSGRDDIVVRAVHWRSDYAMSARLADRYRVGRVFIAGDAAHVHPPTCGYRAPDAPLTGAGGQPLRLFSLLKSGDCIMLRYEPRAGLRIIMVGEHAELRDHEGHLRDAYGFVPGDIALLRLDGYLAALPHDERSPTLAAYFAQSVR